MGRNTTGQQAEVHDRQIRDMFAGIAGVYDRMNGLLSLGLDTRWRKHVARAIDPAAQDLSLIHISEPTRPPLLSRMPSSA